MSILIKGIEMSKTATSIEIVFRNGEKVLNSKRLFCDTSVVRLPTPHGRLKDADALLQRAVSHGWSTPKWVSDIAIEDAPTVIEAEEDNNASI